MPGAVEERSGFEEENIDNKIDRKQKAKIIRVSPQKTNGWNPANQPRSQSADPECDREEGVNGNEWRLEIFLTYLHIISRFIGSLIACCAYRLYNLWAIGWTGRSSCLGRGPRILLASASLAMVGIGSKLFHTRYHFAELFQSISFLRREWQFLRGFYLFSCQG